MILGFYIETVVYLNLVLTSALFLMVGISTYMSKVNLDYISENKEKVRELAYWLMKNDVLPEDKDFIEEMENG